MRKVATIVVNIVLAIMVTVWVALVATALVSIFEGGNNAARSAIFHLFRTGDIFESVAAMQRRITHQLLAWGAITIIAILTRSWSQSTSRRS